MSITNIESLKQNGCCLYFTGQGQSSQTVKTISSNGNCTQILPFPGAGVGIFDGNGDYLSADQHTAFNGYGASDTYTVETDIYMTANSSQRHILDVMSISGTSRLMLYIVSGSTLGFQAQNSTDYKSISYTFALNTWYHIAIVSISGTVSVYINGISQTITTSTAGLSSITTGISVGSRRVGASYDCNWSGYISNLRVSNVARYTANFTPSKRQFQVDSNTNLLLHFQANNATFVDSSPTPKTITAYGNATQLCSPCGSGVVYFDGTGDYLTCGSSLSDFKFLHDGTTAYTIAFWIYPLRFAADNCILNTNNGGSGNPGVYVSINADGTITFWCTNASGGQSIVNGSSTTALILNTMQYVEIRVDFSKANANVEFYISGSISGTLNKSGSVISTANSYQAPRIGCFSTTYAFYGYLSELIISSNWIPTTVPTTPFQPDAYTKLLLHMDGTGNAFYDASNPPGDNGFPILPDGVAVTPAGTWTSIKAKDGRNYLVFNGTANYLTIDDHSAWDLNNNNFTVCAWINLPSSGQVMLFDHYESSTLWTYCFVDEGRFCYSCRNGATMYAGVSYYGTFAYNTWYHVTCVVSNYVATFYVNGQSVAVTIDNAIISISHVVSGTLTIGWNRSTTYTKGNIKDLMIFKGRALSQEMICQIMAETFIQ